MEFVQAKIYFYVNDGEATDIRRIHLPVDITFDDLLHVLKSQQSWVDLKDPLVELTYMDMEEDWISFKSQEEWQLCLDYARQSSMVLRISVSKKPTPASEKVISFVKKIDFKGIWGSVVQNVSSLQPIVSSFANGLCQPQIYEEDVVQPKPTATVVEEVDYVQQMDLTFVDDAFIEDEFKHCSDSFYSDMSQSFLKPIDVNVEEKYTKPVDEDESFESSSEIDTEECDEESEESELSEEEEEEEEEEQVSIPPQFEMAYQQIMDMGFSPTEREKVFKYLIDYEGDVVRVVQHLLEE
jgi:hypothetical protein